MTAIASAPDRIGPKHLVVLLCLVPVLAETVDQATFAIPISGFPLSVGRTLFVLCGIIGIMLGGKVYLRNHTFLALVLISVGGGIGALGSDDVADSLSRTVATILLLVGSAGMARFWGKKAFQTTLDVYFSTVLVYWVSHVLRLGFGSGFASYALLYSAGGLEVRNHHIPGFYISLATVYVALRFFFRKGRLLVPGYALFVLALVCCLFLESRSNTLFTVISFATILLLERKGFLRSILVVAPLLVVVWLALGSFVSDKVAVQDRFTADLAYHQIAASSRLGFVLDAKDAIVEEPFGRGPLEVKLDYGGGRFLAHNQYVTFLIAGGVVALPGILWWLAGFARVFWKLAPARRQQPVQIKAITMVLFTLHLTLFTIEFTDLFFFLLMSLSIHLSGFLKVSRARSNVATPRLS